MPSGERYERERALFRDWRAATGSDDVERFLVEVPAAVSTTRLRRLAIVGPVADPVPPRARELRWWTRSWTVTGWRDRFVLLLTDLGLSRSRVHALAIDDIDEEKWLVAGRRIDVGEAGACRRCVVARWLTILGHSTFGDRGSARDAARRPYDRHECELELDDAWQSASTPVPAVDQYGWLSTLEGLSVRSITRIVGTQLGEESAPADELAEPREVRPIDHARLRELEEDAESRATELLALTAALLDEATDISGRVSAVRSGRAG